MSALRGPCIVCGDEGVNAFSRDGFVILRSLGCGLEWIDAKIEVVAIDEKYGVDYTARWGGSEGRALERVRAMKRATYRVALEEIRRFTRASSLLDVGCALGFLLEEAVEHGFEACGVDQNPEVARLARKRFGDRVWTGALGAEAFLGRDFDVVTLFDVLEHVSDPADLL